MIDIYLRALERCAPAPLAAAALRPDMPRDVVAIGKCAGALFDGVASHARDALVIVPEGYRGTANAEVVWGGHPHMTAASFRAGETLLQFVREHDDLLFLVSGGGSACVEVPLPPHTEAEVAEINARLIESDLPIHEINNVRKRYSAIKGGRIRARVTMVYSDVSSGALADVASGPTIPGDGEVILLADNDTLTAAAAAICGGIRWPGQIECGVEEAAQQLAERARTLKKGEVLVAGGEPTVAKKGSGKGGRCSELAVRFAARTKDPSLTALFAGSDGVDGNSGAAGILLTRIPERIDEAEVLTALQHSDTFPLAERWGEAIRIPPVGNNLRDLFLVARR